MPRQWDSLHPDTLYGDAAARVLCRLVGAEPSGRTLQECLDRKFIEPNKDEAFKNAVFGDGYHHELALRFECKADTRGTGNVSWSKSEMSLSKADVLLAWVPVTDEIWWMAHIDDVTRIRRSIGKNVWLIAKDEF